MKDTLTRLTHAARAIDVDMTDAMRFTSDRIDVKAGTASFGCLEPGHYGAGMKGAVPVL